MGGRVITGFLAALVFIGMKVGIGFLAQDYEVEKSKSQKWSSEFKTAFIDSCTQSATASYSQVLAKQIDDSEAATTLAKYTGVQYCNCMTDKLESSKAIATKYNTLRGPASVKEDVDIARLSSRGLI
ncbi:MAG: hypothetical protein HRT45_18450 [Bdellovibrionales bacterium]|nr:hypothetical protein [Bdellovibrionales bacterium]